MNVWRQALVDRQVAVTLIQSGAWLAVAGDESVLVTLPPGNWIGGSIPYFMSAEGGCTSREQVFVTVIDELAGLTPYIRVHDRASLPSVCLEAPDNGFSLIVLPAFSEVHHDYARHAPGYDDMFMKPVVGWVAGVHLADPVGRRPVVMDGRDGSRHEASAAVLHVPLPDVLGADVRILNLFEPDEGDVIRFDADGFDAREAWVNGQRVNLAAYLLQKGHDSRWPLVADYNGAHLNVSFRAVDSVAGAVQFYAPVFAQVDYRLARPSEALMNRGYDKALEQACEGWPEAHFSCNCILNYLYGELAGRRTGDAIGPMTFGEVGYQLLNQTMVHLSVSPV